ncbi:MAG: hypothetical protein A2V62_10210 [Nitrospirae bacterium RBG_19FT_COMBO_58_9]|nr:MAG: hypothetical protein A2V62_10210 [Nitrospirae bacterium RBG_19FT_COMBO_58_9]
MADEGAPNTCPAIEFFLERQNDDDMIDPSLNPFHAPGTPGPHLRGNIVEHPPTGSLGHTGEMKVQPWIVDQHHEIPGL